MHDRRHDGERAHRPPSPEEIATGGNFDLMDEVYAEDAVEYGAFGREFRGRDAIAESLRSFRAAFPDLRVTVDDAVARGDTVAFRGTVAGTHEGTFAGAEPTGESFEVNNAVFTRIEDGKIVDRWLHPDTFGLLRQVGLVPAPEGMPDGLR